MGLIVGLVLVVLIPVGVNAGTSIYDIIRSNGLIVGKQGKEAKIELNGTISNTTKNKNKKDNPVTVNDNMEIRGAVTLEQTPNKKGFDSKLKISDLTYGAMGITRGGKYPLIPISLGPSVAISENLSVSQNLQVFGTTITEDIIAVGDISSTGEISTGPYNLKETAKKADKLSNFIDCLNPLISTNSADPITVGQWRFCQSLWLNTP